MNNHRKGINNRFNLQICYDPKFRTFTILTQTAHFPVKPHILHLEMAHLNLYVVFFIHVTKVLIIRDIANYFVLNIVYNNLIANKLC